MNDTARRIRFRERAVVFIFAAMVATIPMVALGDPPAAVAPTIPGPFAGAPTNDNPNSGAFSLDVTNRKFGRTPQRYGRLIVATPLGRRQARASTGPSVEQRRAVDRVFVTFAEQLRGIVKP